MTSSMSDPPRRAKGHQPQFFDDPALDQLHAAVLALASELAVAFDRIDTLERLLERSHTLRRNDVECYVPDAPASEERAARRADIAARVLRPFVSYRESLFRDNAAQDGTAPIRRNDQTGTPEHKP